MTKKKLKKIIKKKIKKFKDENVNENKICVKEKKEKHKEFFLFTNFNKSKKSKRVATKKKKANLVKKDDDDSDGELKRIISKNSISTYKSSNIQIENEECFSIISGVTFKAKLNH